MIRLNKYDPKSSYDSFEKVAQQLRAEAAEMKLISGNFDTGDRPIEIEGEPIGRTELTEDGRVRFYNFFDKRELVREVAKKSGESGE